ncbi:hypothetical protein, partial [uncultured Acidovorax sp.]|uniref:hypothetical protein n=1 Tax=uncultured Acidovorax sp. TaxID=158751 RepID=UPI00258D2FAA
HLAQAVGSPAGAIATLRAAATPHWAQLPKGRQKTRFQIPNEKNASQLLTDWNWALVAGFFFGDVPRA